MSLLRRGEVALKHLSDQVRDYIRREAGTAAAGRVISGGGPPSGAAGGDLTGTYPNPSLAAGAVTASHLAIGSVDGAALAANSITEVNIADAAVELRHLHWSIRPRWVDLVAIEDIALTGLPTIDGVAVTNGMHILAAAQTAEEDRDIWAVPDSGSGAWSRVAIITPGQVVAALHGDRCRGTVWLCEMYNGTQGSSTHPQVWRRVDGRYLGIHLLSSDFPYTIPDGLGNVYITVGNIAASTTLTLTMPRAVEPFEGNYVDGQHVYVTTAGTMGAGAAVAFAVQSPDTFAGPTTLTGAGATRRHISMSGGWRGGV